MTFLSAFPSHKELIGLSELYTTNETEHVQQLCGVANLSAQQRKSTSSEAKKFVRSLKKDPPYRHLMNSLLQEYRLNEKEGIALMQLCEALVRTPDSTTAIQLIKDKILNGNWAGRLSGTKSLPVNMVNLGLTLLKSFLHLKRRLLKNKRGADIVDRFLSFLVKHAVSIIGRQFVFGQDIQDAIGRAQHYKKNGYTFSFDLLGEGAKTFDDAEEYFLNYRNAAETLAQVTAEKPHDNSLSIKLSAIHPRYELLSINQCGPDLISKIVEIIEIARRGNFAITIDAEEVERLEVSLILFERLLAHPATQNWDGLGFVVQAYQKRAPEVIELLHKWAQQYGKKIPVRLVKGAYWDSEIKRAQELGLEGYPVFTKKSHTDISYLACARMLLDAPKEFAPQFATHNAHTAMSILKMGGSSNQFELQRLHGMGEQIHDTLMRDIGVRSRIYAPVGKHEDLLPYLIRRLLENGANSSFVNQLNDPDGDIDTLTADPLKVAADENFLPNASLPTPRCYLTDDRQVSKGTDWTQTTAATVLDNTTKEAPFLLAASIVDGKKQLATALPVVSPLDTSQSVGSIHLADAKLVKMAVQSAHRSNWAAISTPLERAAILKNAANLLEEEKDKFIKLCVWEAGKTIPDAIAEVREAVDFCRYYADQATKPKITNRIPIGVVACISPWNFPLAIFLGQVVANLAVGNSVVAKPAEQTSLIACRAVDLLFRAGIPTNAVQLLCGNGAQVGAPLVQHEQIDGVCFTGSTETAKRIMSNLVDTGRPDIPFIAETGGINTAIIDSTALLEQTVTAIIESAFQSAGQRCSACRLVCVQDEIADDFERMLSGAMKTLKVGSTADISADVGPLIDQHAFNKIGHYIENKKREWRIVGRSTGKLDELASGYYVQPIAFDVPSIESVEHEIFGPVLHIFRFNANDLDQLIEDINQLGYGLTMGIHTRVNDDACHIAEVANIGNVYINRNQIGAVVGVQPFGGEGLSGTGPKAGGPHYLLRLSRQEAMVTNSRRLPKQKNSIPNNDASNFQIDPITIDRARKAQRLWGQKFSSEQRVNLVRKLFSDNCNLPAERAFQSLDAEIQLPGPTGENNVLSMEPRGLLLCWPSHNSEEMKLQVFKSLAAGNALLITTPFENYPPIIAELIAKTHQLGIPDDLFVIAPRQEITFSMNCPVEVSGYVAETPYTDALKYRLKSANGAILPVLSAHDDVERYFTENVVTTNTAAAGGNAALMAEIN